MLGVGLGINVGLNGGPEEVVLLIGGCFFLQWVFAISILGLGPWAMGCACGTSKFREPIRSSTSSESVCK